MTWWSFRIVLHTICIIAVQTNDNTIMFEKGYYTIGMEGDTLRMVCLRSRSRPTDIFPPFPIRTFIRKVIIAECDPTNTTYFAELQALNINASELETLSLMFVQDRPLPQGNYTEGLLIKVLTLNNWRNNDILQNVPNFLEPLVNLEFLKASRIQLPPLPKSARLISLSLRQHATIKDWGNCQYLEFLEIHQYDTGNLPKWPQNCTALKSLAINSISTNKAENVIKRMTPAVHGLRTLRINNCGLDAFPTEMLTSAKNLVYLNLANNRIVSNTFKSIPDCNILTTLDLIENLIFVQDLKDLVPKMPSLKEIRFGTSYIPTSICRRRNAFVPLQNWSIEFIQIRNVGLNLSCITGLHFKNLTKLEMTDESVQDTQPSNIEIDLKDLPKTDTGTLEVGLEAKRLLTFMFDETDFKILKEEIPSSSWNSYNNLTVYTKHPISCDCEHGWLARALREFPNKISMPRLLCYHGENHSIGLLDEPLELLECDRTEDEHCIYRKSWRDGTVVAECKEEAWIKEDLPQKIHGLNVSGRGITTLRSKLPDNLQWLDLRRNAISRGNAEEAAALFAAGRRVWLADNSLLCDCDNRALLDAIQQHQDQIEDYDLLDCAGTDEAINQISTAVLCQTVVFTTTIVLGVCGVLAVIAGLTALLLRRYGEQLSMFLYSRGWFVSCLQKLDSDDKPYDAFLSFAHEDQDYVTGTLLPGLENAPEQFRICVHYRDWPIGDWIPVQIMRSVQLSKRTLIVLSRNFVASAWSTLELRYSLANTTEDPNTKVLVLIKDDVLDMDLDKDLRRYLTFNTYLRCDDPWFWEKLRYAMPHRLKKKQSETEDPGARAEVIEMREPAVVFADTDSPVNVQDD